MEVIHIEDAQLIQFAEHVGKERATRLIKQIVENTPSLLKAFAAENGLPVDTEACPTDAFTPDTLRTAEAAVTLYVIRELQKHLNKLNGPNSPTDNHDHGHGGCDCGGHNTNE